MTDLAGFHASAARFLRGEIDAAEFARHVGPFPSGEARMRFYRVLMRRNLASILRKLHPATMNAANRFRAGLWNELVDELERTAPASHFDPNRFGETLSSLLARRRESDPEVPAYLEEIADYQWLEYAVGVAPFTPTRDDIGLDRTLFVRQYDHAVPAFVAKLAKNPGTPLPEARVTTVLVYRDPKTQRAKTFYPTPLGLTALARRARPLVVSGPEPTPMLDAAEEELRKHGVIP